MINRQGLQLIKTERKLLTTKKEKGMIKYLSERLPQMVKKLQD